MMEDIKEKQLNKMTVDSITDEVIDESINVEYKYIYDEKYIVDKKQQRYEQEIINCIDNITNKKIKHYMSIDSYDDSVSMQKKIPFMNAEDCDEISKNVKCMRAVFNFINDLGIGIKIYYSHINSLQIEAKYTEIIFNTNTNLKIHISINKDSFIHMTNIYFSFVDENENFKLLYNNKNEKLMEFNRDWRVCRDIEKYKNLILPKLAYNFDENIYMDYLLYQCNKNDTEKFINANRRVKVLTKMNNNLFEQIKLLTKLVYNMPRNKIDDKTILLLHKQLLLFENINYENDNIKPHFHKIDTDNVSNSSNNNSSDNSSDNIIFDDSDSSDDLDYETEKKKSNITFFSFLYNIISGLIYYVVLTFVIIFYVCTVLNLLLDYL